MVTFGGSVFREGFDMMSRFTSFAMMIALTGAWAGPLARSALAQSQAEIANKLNEEGKELMYADKYAEAAKKFQEAVARVPEAKYFVNLCAARLQIGELDVALTACNAVDRNNPTPDQKSRADKLIVRINEEAKKQNLELHPAGGGGGDPGVDPTRRPDPTRPAEPPPSYTPTVGRPLTTNLMVATKPDHRYTWTLGADFYGGGGRMGQPNYYGSVLGGFRLKSDYLFDPLRRLGAEAYIQWTNMSEGSQQIGATRLGSLTMVDFGVAVYKHACLGSTPRLCITPLAGAHLTTMSPAGSMDEFGNKFFNYDAAGARLELALTVAFGRRYEHAFSVIGGANVYTPVFAGPSIDDPSGDPSVAEAGLDSVGAVGYLGIGYTYRFNTPLGNAPLIILE